MSDHLPLSKDAYSFDRNTREFLCIVLVYLSPEEGTYHLPPNVVEFAPPTGLGPREAVRLNANGDAWEIVPNFRSVMLWDITTCRPVPNMLQLGEAPASGTTAEPPPLFSDAEPVRNVWNTKARAWQQEPDYSRFTVWWKATGEPAPKMPSGQALPDTLTTQCPPVPGPRQALRWNEEHSTWAFIADFRGFTYWTEDGAKHVIDQLGVIPPGPYLTAPPVPTEPPTEPPAAADSTTTEG